MQKAGAGRAAAGNEGKRTARTAGQRAKTAARKNARPRAKSSLYSPRESRLTMEGRHGHRKGGDAGG